MKKLSGNFFGDFFLLIFIVIIGLITPLFMEHRLATYDQIPYMIWSFTTSFIIGAYFGRKKLLSVFKKDKGKITFSWPHALLAILIWFAMRVDVIRASIDIRFISLLSGYFASSSVYRKPIENGTQS